MTTRPKKTMVGWRETVSLPDLGLERFSAKIDTGARTSALHASNIRTYSVKGVRWVEFCADHLMLGTPEEHVMLVLHERDVTNTGGVPETRIIAATTLKIGDRAHPVEVSLSDRANMQFPMIIGRTALKLLRLTVDPSRSWLFSNRPQTERKFQ